jgi:hypothetical protein
MPYMIRFVHVCKQEQEIFHQTMSVMRIHNEQKVNNYIGNIEFVGNIAITPNGKCLKLFNYNYCKHRGL